jgi:folate-dependent phosphoribosylglycinamide formyltransferase PurN
MNMKNEKLPTAVLICHERDRLDTEGLASWLACTMMLTGLVVITDAPGRVLSVARREIRRVGWLGFLDVLAFRLFARLFLRAKDEIWKRDQLARLRARYPADLVDVPRVVVTNPNAEDVRTFLERLSPDVLIARCKFILKPAIFERARTGAFALHPGICPEYRNAHGCFWALVNRDLDRVGMTLLKIDKGVDTGPVYLHAGCDFDEATESHSVIQYRVVLENLDTIGRTLIAICNGSNPAHVSTAGRKSTTWGQPRLTDYLRWKRAARKQRGREAARGAWITQ